MVVANLRFIPRNKKTPTENSNADNTMANSNCKYVGNQRPFRKPSDNPESYKKSLTIDCLHKAGKDEYHASKKRETFTQLFQIICFCLVSKFNLNQTEYGIINHVHIISIHSFRNQSLSRQAFNLFRTVDFHQYQISI